MDDKSSNTAAIESVSCTYLFDRFMYCTTPINQIDKLRRQGDYENCFVVLDDWSTCLQAKFLTDENKRQVN